MKPCGTPLLRVGFGTDCHRLAPGTGLRLGGVSVKCDYSCVADSDGDVLLHAVVDAMLGSVALGDIGEYYTSESVKKGEDSTRFVEETCELLRSNGCTIQNVDAVVEVEVARFSPYRTAVREKIASLLQIPVDAVSVKAKTSEGLDAVGRGEAVRAQAVILVLKSSENHPEAGADE